MDNMHFATITYITYARAICPKAECICEKRRNITIITSAFHGRQFERQIKLIPIYWGQYYVTPTSFAGESWAVAETSKQTTQTDTMERRSTLCVWARNDVTCAKLQHRYICTLKYGDNLHKHNKSQSYTSNTHELRFHSYAVKILTFWKATLNSANEI